MSRTEVTSEQVKEVKQLVLDGRRADAVKLYCAAAGITEAEAETAVDGLIFKDVLALYRTMPINWVGFFGAFVLASIAAGGLTYSLAPEANYVGAAFSALGFVLVVRWVVPKAISSFVASFGAKGRARVVKRVLHNPTRVKDGTVAVVLFEVTPENCAA